MNLQPILNTLAKYKAAKSNLQRKLFFGMGNHVYPTSRQSIGFLVVDSLGRHLGLNWQHVPELMADLAENESLVLIKPKTFQLTSNATSLFRALRTLSIPPSSTTVIYAESLAPISTIRSSFGGRTSHNAGLEAIFRVLKTEKFRRLGIGVGPDSDAQRMQTGSIPSIFLLEEKQLEECRFLNPFNSDEIAQLEDPTFKAQLVNELLSSSS